jgi:hypothetical protein
MLCVFVAFVEVQWRRHVFSIIYDVCSLDKGKLVL